MRKLTLLLLGAVLFTAMGTTVLSAADMKCGSGKCGASMKAPEGKKPACCETKAPEFKKPACCQSKAEGKACTCPTDIKCSCKDKNNCTCPAGKKAKKASPEAMKCGKGKCS